MAAQIWLDTKGIAETLGLGIARTATIMRSGRIPTAELVDGRWQAERGAVERFAKTYAYKGTSLAAPAGHPATIKPAPKTAPKATAKTPAKAATRKAPVKATPAARAGTQTAQWRTRR
jgi:hypothetical protein